MQKLISYLSGLEGSKNTNSKVENIAKKSETTHRILFEPTGGRRVGGWPAEISCAQFSAQASEFVWKLIKIFTLLHPVMVSKNCRLSCNVGWTLFLPYHVTPKSRLRSIINCFYRTQVSLVRSLCPDVRPDVCPWDTLLRLNWCDSGWWRYQVNTNW